MSSKTKHDEALELIEELRAYYQSMIDDARKELAETKDKKRFAWIEKQLSDLEEILHLELMELQLCLAN